MEWIKIKVSTTKKGLDVVADVFDKAGISSVEIEDSEEFLEILEQTKPQWDFVEESLYEEKIKACSVSGYTANNTGGNDTLNIIGEKINSLKLSDSGKIYGSLEMFISLIDEEDWAENWKKYFKPIPVGENVLICPVWEEIPEEYKSRTVFKIDPGMSFGTGTHETTRLCVCALEKHIKHDDTVLDLGSGSGILSIISLLLGAEFARAVDIDENCVRIAGENAKTNNISPEKYEVYSGNLLTDKKLIPQINGVKYNIILMNIIPDVIIPLLPLVKELLAENGVAILSGIIAKYLEDIENAVILNGLQIVEKTSENDWQCVVIDKI
ncbi:MAG: 50S ribosomal protein L11 methyltransferase [Oscillospiraceae bacterium]|nr:50S ribosomal protein L11 methyltransferase [Oscillospiraceae bacterium]